jgi:hypothetical protein
LFESINDQGRPEGQNDQEIERNLQDVSEDGGNHLELEEMLAFDVEAKDGRQAPMQRACALEAAPVTQGKSLATKVTQVGGLFPRCYSI